MTKYNLCCLLHNPPSDLYLYKTITWASYLKNHDTQRAISIWRHNLQVLGRIIQYCATNNWGLRISSSLMPLATHPEFSNKLSYVSFAGLDAEFQKLRDLVNSTKIRLSMHPGQFCVLESENEATVDNAIKELNWHGWFMDQLSLNRDYNSPINLHIHTSRGNFYDLSGRFIRGFLKLDESVQKRLTLENNDKGGDESADNTPWHCENLLQFRDIASKHIPKLALCYDNLHDWLLSSPGLSPEKCFQAFYDTWNINDGPNNALNQYTPIFHHSESRDVNARDRSHADLPSFIPENYGKPVHWDVELKYKELALLKLQTIV